MFVHWKISRVINTSFFILKATVYKLWVLLLTKTLMWRIPHTVLLSCDFQQPHAFLLEFVVSYTVYIHHSRSHPHFCLLLHRHGTGSSFQLLFPLWFCLIYASSLGQLRWVAPGRLHDSLFPATRWPGSWRPTWVFFQGSLHDGVVRRVWVGTEYTGDESWDLATQWLNSDRCFLRKN